MGPAVCAPVLIAAQDGAVAGRVAEALSVLGLRATLVFDPEEAATWVAAGIAVAVVDERLHGADGPLWKDPRLAGLPLVLLADEHAGDGHAARAPGAAARLRHGTAPAEVALATARLLGPGAGGTGQPGLARLGFGDLVLDLATHEVRWHGRPVPTTPHQRRLLEALLRAGGSVMTGPELAEHLYGRALPGDEQRLAAHVKRLRKQFAAAAPELGCPVVRVRAVGYRLAHPSA